MIRIGKVVKEDNNPLMNVSTGFLKVVRELSVYDFPSNNLKLLACLVISQTEKEYKKYLIKVLTNLERVNSKRLIDEWQEGSFETDEKKINYLLSKEEVNFLSQFSFEDSLEQSAIEYKNLFSEGLVKEFYPTKKKSTLILRRLIMENLKKSSRYNEFQKLILHFIAAQLLVSWESACVHLGLMILKGWEVPEMYFWMNRVWPIYYETE